MGTSVYSRGKTIQEAIELALEQLRASKDQVEIEIIEEGGKRMFGLSHRPALVRVTKVKSVEDVDVISKVLESYEETVESAQDMQANIQEVDKTAEAAESLAGKAWVKDGEILCRNKHNQYPVIEVSSNVTLYRNQSVVKEPTIIKEEDELIIELHEERIETFWSIEVDPQHRSVTLNVKPGVHQMHVLIDQPPSTRIHLETEQVNIPLLQLKKKDVISKLAELKINHGIDESLIERACACNRTRHV